MTITLTPLTIILLIIACIIIGAVTYFCCDALSVSSLKNKIHFNNEQEKIKQGLVEKKEAAEKEMTDEIMKSIQDKKEQMAAINHQYEIRKTEYNKQVSQLDQQYQATRDAYAKMDKEAEAERQKENAEIVAAATKEREQKIAAVNAQYEKEKDELKVNFQTFSDEINLKKAALTEEIKAFEARQAAIVAQFKKDEETRKQRDFYHISIDSMSVNDIAKLKSMAPSFSRPEIFYKLLYETYYKALMEELFKRVLGDNKDKGGIYKITNINDEKVYIGKTTKFIDRWRTHAKRGCNIERIAGQIYDALFKEGLENFTWEIVEVCPKEEQTEKEKYWIEFYHSDQYGYNMKKG